MDQWTKSADECTRGCVCVFMCLFIWIRARIFVVVWVGDWRVELLPLTPAGNRKNGKKKIMITIGRTSSSADETICWIVMVLSYHQFTCDYAVPARIKCAKHLVHGGGEINDTEARAQRNLVTPVYYWESL